jgi:DNA-binding transcriptional MerR regulator
MEWMTISEVAAASGVTAHTLRYYERIGLISGVPRASSGHRRYGPEQLRWIEFLRRMHATGMPIRRMQQYARLVRAGDTTVTARRALLMEHRAAVAGRIAELEANLAIIDKKIRMYGGLERHSARQRA